MPTTTSKSRRANSRRPASKASCSTQITDLVYPELRAEFRPSLRAEQQSRSLKRGPLPGGGRSVENQRIRQSKRRFAGVVHEIGGSTNVRFGSLADIASRPRHVRYSPQSGHSTARFARPLSAKSGLSRLPRILSAPVDLADGSKVQPIAEAAPPGRKD